MSEHCSKKLHEHLRKAVGSQIHLEQKTKGRVRRLSSDTPPSPPSLNGALPMEGIQAALVEAFLSIDKELFKKGSAKDKGTTAVVALLGNNHIWVANCGEGESPISWDEEKAFFSGFATFLVSARGSEICRLDLQAA